MEALLLCPWESPTYFILSSNVPPLLHYSHFVAVIAALLVGGYVFLKNRQSLTSQLLLTMFALFSFWAITDVFIWATNRTDIVIFWWSLQVLVEPLIYAIAFYLFHAFSRAGFPASAGTIVIGILLLPLILLAPTHYNLEGIYLADCDAEEGLLALYYTYFLEILFSLGIIASAIENFFKTKETGRRAQIIYFALGLLAFLVAFTSGNILGSITGDWDVAQYGLFGMPIFVGLLAYLIVHYRVFNVKVLAAQALVLALWILIGSLLLVVKTDLSRIVSAVTLVIVVWFGILLVRSVKREVEQRELIEKQEKELEVVNAQQENLLHFISHEVKGYLTKSEAGFAAITEGDFGEVSPALKTMTASALVEVRKGVATIMDILDASNMKKGTVSYKKESFDFGKAVETVVGELQNAAKERSLTLAFNGVAETFPIIGDQEKIIQHVIRNIIDNSIKYTERGSVAVTLSKVGKLIQLLVQDTGIGITAEDMARLFTEGGHGKDSMKVNVHSTGYGLYIAKQIVEAHGGKIWAESEGAGKGSRFIVQFPLSAKLD